jgi:hypothetical protein
MDARRLVSQRMLRLVSPPVASRRLLFQGLLLSMALAVWMLSASLAVAASARTQNFIVTAGTQELANEIAVSAERFRKELALEWLGQELPPWEQPCPITAQVDPRYGAGGATSFIFGGGRPHSWQMSVQGSRERVLDSVLPHEVMHTIFATHFCRPLPRWADEGACTTVEHASERQKQEKLLYQFLTTNRGIAFNRMFAMKEYPQDILPLYSQGYSVARFLLAIGGKQTFVEYLGEGMNSNNWTAATKKHYGFHSLSDLQLTWVEWVRKGTPAVKDSNDVLYVSSDSSLTGRTLAQITGKAPAAVIADNSRRADRGSVGVQLPPPGAIANVESRVPRNPLVREETASKPSTDGWYARRRDEARARSGDARVAAHPPEASAADGRAGQSHQGARPQGPQQLRQRSLELSRDGHTLTPVDR